MSQNNVSPGQNPMIRRLEPTLSRSPLLRSAAAGLLAVALMGAGGKTPKKTKPAAKKEVPAKVETAVAAPPAEDFVLPLPEIPDEMSQESTTHVETIVATTPVEPVDARLQEKTESQSASGAWRILAAGSLDVSGSGLALSGGGSLGVRRLMVASEKIGFELGLRASYGPRMREATLLVQGRGLDENASFYAKTGDVSLTFTSVFTPFSSKAFELELEGGAGLAWRSGFHRMLGETYPVSGVGPAVHMGAGVGYRLTKSFLLGLRLEGALQPQPFLPDATALPSDLGAFRTMVGFHYSP